MVMEKVLQEIHAEYSDLQKARILMVQNDYVRASEAYSTVLSVMAQREKEDSLKMCAVYLEYATCLLLSNDKLVINPNIEEDNEYLEDLAIAWELLEIAKNVFKQHNFTAECVKAHLLLSDISEETSNYKDALEDLQAALTLMREKDPNSQKIPDVLFRIATAYEALEEREMAISTLEEIITVLKKSEQTSQTLEIVEEVKEKIDRVKYPEKYTLELKKEQLPIDPTQPVQKIKLGKKESQKTSSQVAEKNKE